MEAKTALVRTNRAVELHAIAEVDLHFTLVVHPRHAESDDTFGLDYALHNLRLLELGMLIVDVLNAVQYLADSLKILSFARMLLLQALHDFLYVHGI